MSKSYAATLTVTSTANTGAGSLRTAITNAVAGDTIVFAIPATDTGCSAGVCTISPTSNLPALSKGNVTIDGFTQTGATQNTNDFPAAINANLTIVLNGTSAGSSSSGITITSDSNIIRGLVINSFKRYGVSITGSSNRVQGCIIGLDVTGETITQNVSSGIYMAGTSSQGNILGTDGDGASDAAERNVISGNGGGGIYINAGTGQNTIAGNFIGTDKDGLTDLGNTGSGIYINTTAVNNWIGTDGDGTYDAGEGNLISGNSSYGFSSSSNGNVIAGNIIGLDATGTTRLNNDLSGITITGNNVRIGTNGDGVSDALERNIITGNSSSSNRAIIGSGSNVIVAGNYIGVDINGTNAIGSNRGIQISATGNSWIIGTNGDGVGDENEGNVISGSVYNLYLQGNNHVITGNKIGVDATGTIAITGNSYGVRIYGGTGYRVGTNADGVSDEEERNIISGNTSV